MLKERTTLRADVIAGASTVRVMSAQGFAVGDSLYLGTLRRKGFEKAAGGGDHPRDDR